MGALTATRPKPLIEVAGRALIDHALDLVAGYGPPRVVVNLHYLPDQITAHLAGRDILFSHETPEILETGGGLRAALPLLGPGPVFTMNTDAVWRGPNPLCHLAAKWRPEEMDALLLCVPPGSRRGPCRRGRFPHRPDGRATRGPGLIYSGVQIIKPDLLHEIEDTAFSLNVPWDRMLAEGRLSATPYPGRWCDVGRPEGSRRPRRCSAMFEPTDSPRVFGLPPGLDFPRALVEGLRARHAGQPPEALARVTLIVNTRRMARRIRDLFDEGPPCLLPRISLVTDLGEMWDLAHIPDPVPRLRRRLELVQLISTLLDGQPDLAPRSAIFHLADSLAGLMDEMHGEGVAPQVIEDLDVTDQSGHWARIKAFLGIVRHYFEADPENPDVETRQRMVIERLTGLWAEAPPQSPIIVAGSTGSRGATQILMQAVARLPQGAVVLPGFDFDAPAHVWEALGDPMTSEDHPQYRFVRFAQGAGITARDVRPWSADAPPHPARNALISLALRPAPVTDQWLRDGPALQGIEDAMADVTLIEAPSTRTEALAIAMRLRQAAEDGQTAALITPDRTLSRQVTAALDRWHILPDDSAGQPLHLSPPGRFLRHVADLFRQTLSAEALLTLLKHPLTHQGAARGDHLRLTRDLELHLRRFGPPYPTAESLRAWAAGKTDPLIADWVNWICACFTDQAQPDEIALDIPRVGPCRAGRADRAGLSRRRVRHALAEGGRAGRAQGGRWLAGRGGGCGRAERRRLRQPVSQHPCHRGGPHPDRAASAYPDLGHAGGAGAGRRSADPRRAQRGQLARGARARSVAQPVAAPSGGAAAARTADRPVGA